MEWNFKFGAKQISFTISEQAIAVKPAAELRESVDRANLIGRFGQSLALDAEANLFAVDVSFPYREFFERAGWIFVAPQAQVAVADEARRTLPGTEALGLVLTNSAGELMVGTDLLTVQLSADLSEEQAFGILNEDRLTLVRRLRFAPNTFEVRIPPGPSLPEIVNNLQERTDRYRFAEPELMQVMSGRLKPTDPNYNHQWQHNNDGSNGGIAGADIHSELAWNHTRGVSANRPIRLALIDNGMDISHPDLAAGIVGGGYFHDDGVGGATLVRFQNGMANFPGSKHGTFCLGMAGARMSNNLGGCGSAPEAALLAIACLSDQLGTQVTLARAVAYAADPTREDSQASAADGADVISCSLGPATDWDISSTLDLAIRFAAAQGRNGLGSPIFWAVSNSPVEVSRDEVCSHPDVIAVGRSNRNDHKDGSAHGPKLEFLAPGREVYSTIPGGYGFGTGTSYATPLAAGVGALVLSRYPNWTRQQVQQRLIQSCDQVGGVVYDAQGHNNEYGYGRLNADRAVQ